ncbi:RlmE/FtsJ family methyltransferase [Candidatus Vidania fulgoroideorum]
MKKKKNTVCKSFFKIKEINDKERIFKVGYKILEFGSFPGGWSKYILDKYKKIFLVSVDLKKSKKLDKKRHFFIKLNIFDKKIINKIKNIYKKKFDIIISDVCPNITGIKLFDKQNFISIIKRLHFLSVFFLKKKKNMIFKILSEGFEKKIRNIFCNFEKIKFLRLKFKKKRSSEMFVYLKKKNEL